MTVIVAVLSLMSFKHFNLIISGGFKRSFDNGGGSGGGQNKKIKFDD